jgi:hypothetical protein
MIRSLRKVVMASLIGTTSAHGVQTSRQHGRAVRGDSLDRLVDR